MGEYCKEEYIECIEEVEIKMALIISSLSIESNPLADLKRIDAFEQFRDYLKEKSKIQFDDEFM